EVIQERDRQLRASAHLLSARPDALVERISALQDELKRLGREVDKWKQAAATGGTDYMSRVVDVKGVKVLAVEVDGMDAKGLRPVLDQLKDKLGSGVIVLGSVDDEKVALCAGVTKDLTARVRAGDVVGRIAPIVEGSGGGRPDMAQAGGKKVSALPEALSKVAEVVSELLG
ncbi:MAG TPA: DHHA1 domain-containing protein, partial [Candidatus Hydrogenedentes bacterium]|nr:DHHA1 domain-containing protein [Candidatus Hydrogenedentota bacterium]